MVGGEGECLGSPSNEDFSGPHYKRRGMNHLSVNRLQRQHGCPSEQNIGYNNNIIKVLIIIIIKVLMKVMICFMLYIQ